MRKAKGFQILPERIQLANLVKVQNTCLKSSIQYSFVSTHCQAPLCSNHIPMWAVLATQWPLLPSWGLFTLFKFKVGKNCTWEWIIHFILFCHVLTASLLSLAGHRDKLKIKSTRKIIYKSTFQAHAFYPYCSVNVLPPPPSGEKNQCFPSQLTPAKLGADTALQS